MFRSNVTAIRNFALILGSAIVLFFSNILIAQDDPRFDNAVGVLPPEAFTQPPPPAEKITITTDDGFDNFFLGLDFAEPHMSSNPMNPLEYFNAWNTNGTHYTYDGHDWETQSPPFPGYSMRGDPVTAYDSLGNLYYQNMYGSPSIQGALVIRSTDNGATWGAPAVAVSGVDKCWLACDQTAGPNANNVYAVMTGGAGGNFARSTDFGATWQTTQSFATQSLPGMMVAVGPDVLAGNDISGGCVYVVTNGGNTFAPTYTFYRSFDGGSTFTLMSSQLFANYVGTNVSGRHSVENMRTRPYPFIAADNSRGPYRGRLYCVYASNTPSGNGYKPDIFVQYSDDQGFSWSGPILINDDPNTTNNHQWSPAIWVDKETGRFYAKWYDSRNVPTSDSCDVYASYSDDGGVTWAPNQRLTNARMVIDCATCPGGGTPRYQGDYDAITSNPYGAMAVWTDFRDGTFGSYTAYFPDFAMKISSASDTIGVTDSIEVSVKIPAVKLYEHSVKFSVTSEPYGDFIYTFPQGDSLSIFPDSIQLVIKADSVVSGDYDIIVQAEGPNGTPVHRRTISLLVTAPFIALQQPNGGEELYAGATYDIMWELALVDSIDLDYSPDSGATWINIVSGLNKNDIFANHPKSHIRPFTDPQLESVVTNYEWTVPSTLTSTGLVRVSSSTDSGFFDISDTTFSIVPTPLPKWTIQDASVDTALYSVSIVDTSIVWAGGANGTIIRSFDGGKSWTATPLPSGEDIYNICAVNQTRVFIAVNSPGSAKIVRTYNGGSSWQTVYENNNADAFINAVHMFDIINGYAVGDPVNGQWTILKTIDGGFSWTSAGTLSQSGSETGYNNSFTWMGDQLGWFGTNNNRIYRTTNGGTNWSPATTSFANSFSVSFATDLLGLAAGEATDLSQDGGATWSAAGTQLPAVSYGTFGLDLDPQRWYSIAGSEVYRTIDQGDTFSLEISQSNTLFDIDMKIVPLNENRWLVGYAVGDNGAINRYRELLDVTIVNSINQGNIPDRFALSQNYPNPFNPTTTISYQLPVNASVTMRIINMLGQEVRVLDEGSKNAGNYEITWDGRNSNGLPVASGIYFYHLSAKSENGKEYSAIRKMMILK